MNSKHQQLRGLLTNAIVELCRREAFYLEELRIEGTVCLVSDSSSVLIAHITEHIGDSLSEAGQEVETVFQSLPILTVDQSPSIPCSGEEIKAKGGDDDEDVDSFTSENSNSEQEESQVEYSLVEGGQRSEKQDEHSALSDVALPSGKDKQGKYQCPFCPKCYQFKHSLKDHLNKHTGRRPHACTHCGRTFIHIASLSAHMKRRHLNLMPKEYQCQLCGDHFSGEQSLKQHFSWRHKGQWPDSSSPSKKARLLPGADTEDPSAEDLNPQAGSQKDLSVSFPLSRQADDSHKPEEGDLEHHQAVDGGTDSAEEDCAQLLMTQPQKYLHDEVNDDNTSQSGLQNKQHGSAVGTRRFSPTGLSADMGMRLPVVQVGSTPGFEGMPVFSSPSTAASVQEILPIVSPEGTTSSPKTPDEIAALIPDIRRSADGKFWCPYCDKCYNFKHTLKDHLNKHMGRKPHACKHCGDSFTHFASLCAHLKRRHDEHMPKNFQCNICNEKFLNEQSLKQHYTWRHKGAKLQSVTPIKVETTTASSSAGSGEMSQLSGAGPPLVFPGGSSQDLTLPPMEAFMRDVNLPLSAQMPTVFPGPQPSLATQPHPPTNTQGSHDVNEQCSSTEFRFPAGIDLEPTRQTLQGGMPEYPSGNLMESPVQARFGGSPPREEHVQQSSEPSSSLITLSDYFENVNIETDGVLYKYKCKVCGNLFKIRNSLYEHVNSHLGKRPHVCTFCGDSFTHHSSLHNHVRNKHTFQSREEREASYKHECRGCGRRFRFLSELQRHLKTNPDHDFRGPKQEPNKP